MTQGLVAPVKGTQDRKHVNLHTPQGVDSESSSRRDDWVSNLAQSRLLGHNLHHEYPV
jgi:hypothetical protein